MKNKSVIAILLVGVFLGIAAGYFISASTAHVSTTTTTVTSVSTITEVSSSSLNNGIYLMNINGSFYWADDVSRDIVVGNPGYSYFLNESVTFDNVTFRTICGPIYSGCPVPQGVKPTTTEIVGAGAILFNMTFPDGSTERAGEVIGDSIYSFVISQHNPRAGMLIEYVNDYPHNSIGYGVFLLVSSCCTPPYLK